MPTAPRRRRTFQRLEQLARIAIVALRDLGRPRVPAERGRQALGVLLPVVVPAAAAVVVVVVVLLGRRRQRTGGSEKMGVGRQHDLERSASGLGQLIAEAAAAKGEAAPTCLVVRLRGSEQDSRCEERER